MLVTSMISKKVQDGIQKNPCPAAIFKTDVVNGNRIWHSCVGCRFVPYECFLQSYGVITARSSNHNSLLLMFSYH